MEVFHKMVSTQAVMFLYMLVGVVAAKTGILKKEGRASIVSLQMNIFLPCMVLDSFQMDINVRHFMNAASILLVSAASTLLMILVGKWLWRKKPESRRPVLEYITGFSNLTTSLPIMEMVYGMEAVFYASFFFVPVRVLVWTVGIGLFVKQKGKMQWKSLLLNPSLLAMAAGLFLMCTSLTLPPVLGTAVKKLGSFTGPLTLLLVGASLAGIRMRDVLEKEVLQISAIHLLLMPLLAMVVLRLLGMNELLWQISVILLGMPAASNGALFAEQYGYDHVFGSKCVFLSAVLALFTIPLLTLLF